MMPTRGFYVPLVLAVTGLVAPAARAQQANFPRPAPSLSKTIANHLRFARTLATPVDTKPFQKEMTLREALDLLTDELSKNHPAFFIQIDHEVLEGNMGAGLDEILVKLPPAPRKQSAASVLQSLLGQIPAKNAAYSIQMDRLEIVTRAQAAEDRRQRILQMTVPFNRNPLFRDWVPIVGKKKIIDDLP
jgi:hypothetical protein